MKTGIDSVVYFFIGSMLGALLVTFLPGKKPVLVATGTNSVPGLSRSLKCSKTTDPKILHCEEFLSVKELK